MMYDKVALDNHFADLKRRHVLDDKYLDSARAAMEDVIKDIDQNDGIVNKRIYDAFFNGSILRFLDVDIIVSKLYAKEYGNVILYEEFMGELVKFLEGKKVLSIMSWIGTLQYHLKKRGIDIIATDLGILPDNNRSVINMDTVDAVGLYGKEVDYVLCANPPFLSDEPRRAIKVMRKVNPDLVMIYIGEDRGGWSANYEFFNTVKCVRDINADGICKTFKTSITRFEGIHLFK